jgi:hypothetical protein
MPVAIYMDAHIPRAITEQLRLRGIEVLAATEEGTNRLPDDQLLETASALRHCQLFVEVGDLVALLQAKARRYLAEHPAA